MKSNCAEAEQQQQQSGCCCSTTGWTKHSVAPGSPQKQNKQTVEGLLKMFCHLRWFMQMLSATCRASPSSRESPAVYLWVNSALCRSRWASSRGWFRLLLLLLPTERHLKVLHVFLLYVFVFYIELSRLCSTIHVHKPL